jgi:hypothetical protein
MLRRYVKRVAKRVAQRVFNSQLFRDTLRQAILSDEFRSQLRQGQLDLVASPEFRDALHPHYMTMALHPDLRGMDVTGQLSRVNRGMQLLLNQQNRQRLHQHPTPMPLRELGYRCFSPSDEDGIIQFLLVAIAKPSTYRVVELGAGTGYECLSANLLINHGYHGLLVFDNREHLATAKLFYDTRHETSVTPPRLIFDRLESNIVNLTLSNNGFSGEIDLLSIDINGIDYWVWQELTVAQPRIVALKYHPAWPASQAKTIPNIKNFTYSTEKPGYQGASLAAFIKLGTTKGYRFVGANGVQSTAFFVRNDLAEQALPAVPAEQGLDGVRLQLLQQSIKPASIGGEWVDV